MQNERTLEFWDQYHKENESKEWILQPSVDLLEVLRAHCSFVENDDGENAIRLLEIGCGTSTLARDFWQHLINSENDQRSFHMIATDVSPACIQTNIDRDCSLLLKSRGGDDDIGQKHTLEYRTLNVIQPSTKEEDQSFQVILDKGCLDTFLFRSRNRGGSNTAYSSILQTLLDNVWSWMGDDGVYLLVSPRAKVKAVRDYSGFRCVERHALPTLSRGDLVGNNNDTPGYVYVCRKNTAYVIGETPAFAGRMSGNQEAPNDKTKCPKCGMTFQGLRKGEVMEGRGTTFWIRRWKGHCIHCKGDSLN
eukprot:scaffold5756_cov99-Cylindrotheca_fusiformis.AAC.6